MTEELFVILGAEVTLLVCVTAMSLVRKRMDVLSELNRGAPRTFAGRHSKSSPHSILARAWALLSQPEVRTAIRRLTRPAPGRCLEGPDQA